MVEALGIRSLSAKLDNLDKKLNKLRVVDFDTPSFELSLVKNIEQRRRNEKIEQIKDIKSHFVKGLLEQINVINKANILQIIIYAIKWIESNGIIWAKALGCDLNSDLKLDSCVSLILEIIEADQEFLKNSINTLVKILFPHEQPVIHTSIKRSKSGIFLKKSKKDKNNE